MDALVHGGLQGIIVFAMTVVGLELTRADLARVLHYPAHVGLALGAQTLLLPIAGATIIVLLRPDPVVAGGLILVAAAPQATISSFYCLLARSDVALSVTLTAVSSVTALVTTPWIASLGFDLLLDGDSSRARLPVGPVMRQVVTGILLPIGAGMLIRHRAPRFAARCRVPLQRASLAALVVLLVTVMATQADAIASNLRAIVVAALVFTAMAVALGLVVARVLRCTAGETVAMVAGFPSRSLSVATLVALNVLASLEFLAFAVVFFVVQAGVLVPAMLYGRRFVPR
ncbi:MAG: hypothetical protein GC151_10675 [Betaproteobacteria bacterium]|nr:hypothetical protein [Betaproteobacteria bacterium]